jgi:hypothetical protein
MKKVCSSADFFPTIKKRCPDYNGTGKVQVGWDKNHFE